MFRSVRGAGLVLALGMALPAVAEAQTRLWENVCGGSTFTTCASVSVTVTGTSVTMRAWNLSGAIGGSDASAVFTSIALYNLPVGVTPNPGVIMTGPSWTGASTAPMLPWTTSANSVNGSGISLTRPVDPTQPTSMYPMASGIASNCAPTGAIKAGTKVWMSQNAGCSQGVRNATLNGGYVQMSFTVNSTFDPNADGIGLGITAINSSGSTSQLAYYTSSTPEPTTMLLLGSGLLGIGGAGWKRRRKKELEPPAAI